MAEQGHNDEFAGLGPLLDTLPPLQPDRRKVDALVAMLAPERPRQQAAPAADPEWPLFLGMCGGGALVGLLLLLVAADASVQLLAEWMLPGVAFVGVSSLGVLAGVVWQRRPA